METLKGTLLRGRNVPVLAVAAPLVLVGVGICVTYVIGVWPSEEVGVDWAARLERIRNVAIILGGIVALGLAYWRGKAADRQASAAQAQVNTASRQIDAAHEQVQAAQEQGQMMLQGQLNQRYEKGSEMLGSSVLSVRMGGIFALERLAQEHPTQYHVEVMKVLFAFIRQPIDDGGTTNYKMIGVRGARQDVQAALDAVRLCRVENRVVELNSEFFVDLHGADLRKADLSNIDLSTMFVSNVRAFRSRSFGGRGVVSDLSHATVTGAELSLAIIASAHCAFTDFSDSRLVSAKMPNAFFIRTSFRNAHLGGADVSGASFEDANLRGAKLRRTNLSGAKFTESEPRAMGLTQEQLNEACADPSKRPDLGNVVDADTGEALVWRGGACDDSEGG